MDVPTPLLRLPPEITEMIAEFLSFNPVAGVSMPNGATAPEIETSTAATTAARKTKADFCALRLTCRDTYLKTFNLFGRYYFSTVSVGFTRPSLNRLRGLASYRNSFGLTLFEFPSHLVVSTHRLLPESEVDRMFSISDPREDAQAVVTTITLLSELGIESYSVPGAYDPDTYAIAGKYRKAVASQQSVTTSSSDINKIARSIGTFPRFCSITLDPEDKFWGEEDWQEIAGFDRRVFTSFGEFHSGQNNLEFATNRILQAIAQAETICQAAERTLNLSSLTAAASDDSEGWYPNFHQNIKLQRLEIHPFSRVALQAALSRLTSLSIDIHDFVEDKELKDSPEKIEQVLKVLLSSPKLEDLTIVFADVSPTFDDMSHPDIQWIGDYILSVLVEVEQSDCLQRLDLFCLAMREARGAVNKLIRKHAATLEAFSLEILIRDLVANAIPTSIAIERHRHKGLLRAVAGCPLLERFSLHVEADEVEDPVAGFYMNGKESIMKRVQYMIESPTEPEYDYLWADDFETEDNDEGDN